MKTSRIPVLVMLCAAATTLSSAIPKPNEEKEGHKTGADRIIDQDLSDQEHFVDEDHNMDYDHEAFLGEQAQSFNDLSPEESKEKLGLIYDKIDTDSNGFVTEEELEAWIKLVQNNYIVRDTERQWKEYGESIEDDVLSWDSYKSRTYGTSDDDDDSDYQRMKIRDKKRWELADGDHDGKLTKKEFSDFLHPEESEHMRPTVVDETLEDIDKNNDGVIDLQEYIVDLGADEEDEEEIEWIQEEREFFEEKDTNQDGVMDREEISAWIFAHMHQFHEESRHLLAEADDGDRDGQLTKEEVLNKYDLFVGSQATDFGEALTRHDEF